MKRRLFLVPFAGLGLAGICTFSSCRPSSEREVAGRVLALAGTAQETSAGKTTALTNGSFLCSGETVLGMEASRIDLGLLPGILVQLQGQTEIEIIRLLLARDGDETIHPMTVRAASVRLVRGSLVASVGQAQTDSSLSIETPAGTVTADPDAVFKLDVTGRKARVLCVRGEVTFQPPAAGGVKIAAGYFADLPSPDPAPRAAASAPGELQAEVPATLDLAQHLQSLEDQPVSTFRPW